MASNQCIVVDYGIGNIFSVLHALGNLDVTAKLSRDRAEILAADRVILPGVGAFGRATARLRELGLDDTLREFASTGRPFLGICVGMQMLMETGSEFGEHEGLGLIGGRVDRIEVEPSDHFRVPLIGWHPVHPPQEHDRDIWAETPFEDLPSDHAFYFVHSFAATGVADECVLAVTRHDGREIVAAVKKDNVIGTQFHPERSAQSGMNFLTKFLAL